MAGPTENFGITVEGLAKLEQMPSRLERAQLAFVGELTQDLAGEVRKQIRSRSGRLAGSWHGQAVSSTLGLLETSGTRYGRASIRGAYFRARGRALVFRGRDGELIFRRWVRIKPGAYIGRPDDRKNTYVSRALRQRRRIAQAALERTIGRA
jgi:hypothetical protein